MPTPSNHSFTSAFPFEIKIENQFMNEGHSTLYIVNKVDTAASEQHLKLLINALDFGHPTFKGFGEDIKPSSDNYNVALAFRSGTLLSSVADAFSKILETAFNEALKEKNNSCRVEGPEIQSDHSQVWYVCFEKDVVYAAVTQNLLTVDLKGVSAEAGNGTRVSQVACQFRNVKKDASDHLFQFKCNTQINIVNHQGAGFAPLHFGVMGSDVMVKGEKNTLKPYFLTKERVPIKLGKDTTFTFNFPYANGNKLPGIGKSDQVEGISPHAVDGHFTPGHKAHDTIHHTWNFPFKANGNKIDTELFEGIFEFSNIQLAEYRGPVIVEVTVKNLPGYWDSAFQIPVVIGDSSLTDALNLVETSTGGNSKALGAKINFLSSGTDEGNFPNVAIEEHWGLELFGTLPDSESQKAGQEIRVRRANLIIPEGKVAIGTKDIISLDKGKTHIFPTDSDAHLYVQGNSQLNGDLEVTGIVKLDGSKTTIKGTTNLNGTQTNITGTTNLNGPVTTSNGKPLAIKGNIKISGTTIVNGPITTENKDQVVTFSNHAFTNGWIGSEGNNYVRGQLAVGKADKPKERFHVDELGNVTVGKGDLTAISGKTTAKELRIDGGNHNALSIGGKGIVQVDYPKVAGGRFQIDDAGNVTVGKGVLTARNNATIHGTTQVFGILKVGNTSNTTNHNASMTVDGVGNVNTFNLLVHGQGTFHQKVGIGTPNPLAPLHVNGHGNEAPEGGQYFDEYGGVHGYVVEGKQYISILAQESVLARRFVANSYAANSDVRIKTGINASDEQQDLLKLLQVKIRNYSYIDYVKNSTKTIKGVVAQELEKTFPEAVSKSTGHIPNIYQLCDQVTSNEGLKELTCELKEPHGLKVGDKVKLITESDQEFFNEVVAVNDAQSFTVKDWEEKAERVFVYGKEVDDFRTVDYTQVSMMGISAIQALHKKVDKLEKENAALKAQLQTEMQSLREEIASMKAMV